MDNQIQIGKTDSLEDFKALIQLFERVFEEDNLEIPKANHLQKLLDNDAFLPIVAKHQGKVMGGATVHLLPQYYTSKPLAYLYDLAVDYEYQGYGIGKGITTYAAAYAKQLGCEEMYLQAESIDTDALAFYRATKMFTEMPVIQFTHKI
jgi:aminoglycoside 3-N-acetyltransferase I